MSELNSRRENEFQQFRGMTDDQLRQILRADAQKTEGEETDVAMLLSIMEELAARRKERNVCPDSTAALDSFRQNYAPEGYATPLEASGNTERKRKTTRWMRGLIAAAAALVLVIGGAVTAGAFGMNVFEIVGKWTKETFYLGAGDQTIPDEPSKPMVLPCASFQELLNQFGVEAKLVPTWLPEGYEPLDAKMRETPKQRMFTAAYQRGDDLLKLQINDYLREYPGQFEQSGTTVEIYESAGISYHIFSNNEKLCAVWIVESYECSISGRVTAEEMKKMIDSIQRG